jgi:hypothetical protein
MNCHRCIIPLEGEYWEATLYLGQETPVILKEHQYCKKCFKSQIECGDQHCCICLERILETDDWWEFLLIEDKKEGSPSVWRPDGSFSLDISYKEQKKMHKRCWEV